MKASNSVRHQLRNSQTALAQLQLDERFVIERVAEQAALPDVRRLARSIATSHQAELAHLAFGMNRSGIPESARF